MVTKKKRKKNNKHKCNPIAWTLGFVIICGALFLGLGLQVYSIDPFFHYHAPDTDNYYYDLYSERYQNDGILRNFDYDAIIIGTSMAQNFKTSEFDELFGVHSVKTTFSGGSFRETGDRLKTALKSNENIKIVIRSLDMDFMFQDYDDLGSQADGDYPEYLYDNNPLNDYKYLLNRDVIFKRLYSIVQHKNEDDYTSGIKSFDSYSNWMGGFWGKFGSSYVIEEELENYTAYPYGLGDADKLKIQKSVAYNFTDIAETYPDVEFYIYIPPYSAVWWNTNLRNYVFTRQIQAEQYFIELMLPYENIHIFSFNTFSDVTTDLNNYKDAGHYGEWINSAILRWMSNNTGLITKDNYLEYIRTEANLYAKYDYTSLNNQEDYTDDKLAEELLMERYFPWL